MVKFDEIKYWAEPLLQGLSYWLGYSRIYYSKSLLKEGAITAEAVKIIHSKLANEIVETEIMYKNLIKSSNNCGQKRADIVIFNNDKSPKFIIEVKRNNALNSKIKEDINRLSNVLDYNKNIKTFLLLVSENQLPKQYVDKSGQANRKIIKIKENTVYKVRRVCKAASSFKKKNNAHFAILIEVYKND